MPGEVHARRNQKYRVLMHSKNLSSSVCICIRTAYKSTLFCWPVQRTRADPDKQTDVLRGCFLRVPITQVFADILHRCMHTDIHTYIHTCTYWSFAHTCCKFISEKRTTCTVHWEILDGANFRITSCKAFNINFCILIFVCPLGQIMPCPASFSVQCHSSI